MLWFAARFMGLISLVLIGGTWIVVTNALQAAGLQYSDTLMYGTLIACALFWAWPIRWMYRKMRGR